MGSKYILNTNFSKDIIEENQVDDNSPNSNTNTTTNPTTNTTTSSNIVEEIKSIIDKKHNKYFDKYKSNDLFWGIGVENETYLQFTNLYKIFVSDFWSKLKRERYSVDYYLNYDSDKLKEIIKTNFPSMRLYSFPLMFNSYTLVNTDINGNHSRVFSKNVLMKSGIFKKSIDNCMKEYDPYFKDNYGKDFIYDGDSIEFMTQNFYKTTVIDTVNELKNIKETYLSKFNKFLKEKCFNLSKFGDVIYPAKNHGFVSFLSNKGNLSVCNNSTYHLNLTLPTVLDKNGNIKDEIDFKVSHSNAIKIIQFLLPFLVASYGTGDFLSKFDDNYFKGSLRGGLSRYISIGTYNSELMKEGKLLDDFSSKDCKWYSKIREENNYNSYYKLQDKIGYDINYKKFKNHGIEIRCIDWFPDEYLEDILNFFILLLSFSQDGRRMCNFNREIEMDIQTDIERDIEKDVTSSSINGNKNIFEIGNHKLYNKLVYYAVKLGGSHNLTKNEEKELFRIIGMENLYSFEEKQLSMFEFLKVVTKELYKLYKDSWVVEKMSPGYEGACYCKL